MIKIDSLCYFEPEYSDQHSLSYLLQRELSENSASTQKNSNKTFPIKSKKIVKNRGNELRNQEKIKKKRTFKGFWSRQQQLQFFYGSIQFVLERRFHSLSWEHWKPDGFYRRVSQHLVQIYGPFSGKDADQCKAKDQSLKRIWFTESQIKKDIVQVSLEHLRSFMQSYQQGLQNLKVDEEEMNRATRFRKILQEYERQIGKSNELCIFEQEMENLLKYSQNTRQMISSLTKLYSNQ